MKKLIKNTFERLSKVVVVTLCVIVFMALSCRKQNNDDYSDTEVSCLGMFSFLDGVSRTSNFRNVYVIKGIALEDYEYGRRIKFVEDLKGNFPKGVTSFIIRRGGKGSDNRTDYLQSCDYQDVLIMHLESVMHLLSERLREYNTLTCTPSVLKLSDGYVTGNIIPWDEKLERWGLENLTEKELSTWFKSMSDEERGSYTTIDTVPWDEFQKRLQELLKIIKKNR